MNYRTKNQLPHDSENYLYDILKSRGIPNPQSYIDLTSQNCHQTDWHDFNQIDQGIPIFQRAMSGKYKVGIIADCDVDGYCSAAITYLYLKDCRPELNINVYFHSGKAHGIDDNILEQLNKNPIDILIIPDASSNQYQLHKNLYENGTQILVLDHHESDVQFDQFAARINNQLSQGSINKTLCGAGVVFFFLMGIDSIYKTDYAAKYIDLVAVAQIADMMDLRNYQTRCLVKVGLSNIKNSGLKAFLDSVSYSLNGRQEIYPMDIAFYIAPLINAVIRVGTMQQKQIVFFALIDGNKIVPSSKRGAKPGQTQISGQQAARIAKNCKALQAKLVQKAMQTLQKKITEGDLLKNKILLIPVNDQDDIPSTITGLVAMKLTAKYHHPTMVLRECQDGVLKGSTRAQADTAIGSFKDYMMNTGLVQYAQGHALANGAGIQETKVDDFITQTNQQLKDVDFNQKYLTVDYIFEGDQDIEKVIFNLQGGKQLWGQGVEQPTVIVENIRVAPDEVKFMKNNCLKFTCNDVSYIIFKNQQAVQDFTFDKMMNVTIYGKCSVNEWAGRKNAQIIINNYDIKKVRYQF